MPEVEQNVVLVAHTPEPEKIIATGARLCYSKTNIADLMKEFENKDTSRFINMLRERGHLSPFEHASFTFLIEGISRSASHQLVRHRISSYSQQSQRFCDFKNEDDFSWIAPPKINEMLESDKITYVENMENTKKDYNKLRDLGCKPEDARFVLPNAAETKIMVTMNCRALINFFDLRTQKHAQWEIRSIANKMLKICKELAPNVFRGVGHSYLNKPLNLDKDGEENSYGFQERAQFYISERFNIPYVELSATPTTGKFFKDGLHIDVSYFSKKSMVTYLTFVDKSGDVRLLGKYSC